MDALDAHQPCDGLEFIVEHPEYVVKLATALNAIGPTATRVKKQMFELLAALCSHNEVGRIRTLETLECYKKLSQQKSRMGSVVHELEHSRSPEYQLALVAFINCLIISTVKLPDRIQIRNEFIECHLLEVLTKIRKSGPDYDLLTQIEVFDEQLRSDNAEQDREVKMDSPQDVFHAILKQVSNTPHSVPFLHILQHLLAIDPNDPLSDLVWENAEKLVQRATEKEDFSKLVRANSRSQLKVNCTCSRRQSLLLGALSPPPPPIPPGGLPPPPPPFPHVNVPPPPPPLAPHTSAIPPPPPISQEMQKGILSPAAPLKIERLPQQEIPAPKSKMKTVNWNKIPSNKVVGTNNIWTQVAMRHQHSPLADIDWSEMEGLFCQQGQQSLVLDSTDDATGCNENRNLRRTRKEPQEITLLDGKRSLNVNIFLKQFRSSNDDIIRLISHGEHHRIGIEKLKGLLKILPEVDELDMLKSFDGDVSKLGNAEKFLIHLTSLSNYKLRIESMLLKEEFESNMAYVKPSIKAMILAAQELMTNKPLQEVLYMILVAGNFLNAGGYAGNAAGIKLSSLQKIMDIRANRPNMNLIHFVAQQAERRGNILLSFTDNIAILEEAAKTTVEQLKNEIYALEERIQKIEKQIDLPTTEIQIKEQMTEFLLIAGNDVSNLQTELKKLDTVRQQLAEFFCEDLASFKIEECFRIFHAFTCKFKQAVIENERRKHQEEQANARKRQREELLAAKRRQMGNLNTDEGVIEMQIYDSNGNSFRKGFKTSADSNTSEEEFFATSPLLPRHRLSSFNGCGVDTERDQMSPDSSPNGSLRRRRSKGMIDNQGNLMDFLRHSSDVSNRERKSWGSLDRSWARKAKGAGPKKRPGLFTADFLFERDRTATPSPVVEVKGSISAPEEELMRVPKPVGNKVETAPLKDKSAWRKSTLNVPNSSEEIRSSHRRESHTSPDINILQPIMETNDRKELIGSLGKATDTEKLTLYLRKPQEVQPARALKAFSPPPPLLSPDSPTTTRPNRDGTFSHNKIEIDQDNVQTPPLPRKIFSPTPTEKREPLKPSPCKRVLNKADNVDPDQEILGDGQFNRFSPTRRTRRQVRTQAIKKPVVDQEELSLDIKSPEIDLKDFLSPVCIKVEPESNVTAINNENQKIPNGKTSKTPTKPERNGSAVRPNRLSLPLSTRKDQHVDSGVTRSSLLARTSSITTDKKPQPSSRVALKRNSSLSNSKTKLAPSTSSENFNSIKRNSSVSAPKPSAPRSQGFMKPTTSSTTKSSTPSVRRSVSVRSRN
ncbi:inverted formin-2 [Anthonomus grandis grandis]|uniref:inverted formin-2 n=1 Tax=Anthonomus grandis grandis TaxID=2921223 RepID=UPI002164FADC|nr:inverted formin-2 [Anthonomus grandis grandis]XP_050312284.1 inverted formin-2 [Anthonomus grandis grandis]